MNGSLTLELQALGRPEVALALEQAGQDVLIQRPGQPDVPARAILYQLENKRAGGIKGAVPAYGNIAWQGIFFHDAPILQPGYTIRDQGGRVFVPEGEAEDPGEQQVALIVRLGPLVERTRLSLLTFPGPSLLGNEPGTGNPIELPGPPLEISARLEATTDPRLRETVGADRAQVVLVGRWGSFERPTGRPAGVRWGSRSPLTIDGQSGVLTISLAWPDSDLASETQFGGRFLASWEAG